MRALDKDRAKDGESKRKRDSERVHRRYLNASDREDSPEGRSQPFSTENDTWLLWLLSSPVSLRPQTQACNKHRGERRLTHTLKDTQSHTVYCLDYIIFIPGTWALLVGWHLGLCSTKVTFLCPWVKDACLQHAFEMKGMGDKKKKSDEKDFQKHFDQRHQQSRTNLLSSM